MRSRAIRRDVTRDLVAETAEEPRSGLSILGRMHIPNRRILHESTPLFSLCRRSCAIDPIVFSRRASSRREVKVDEAHRRSSSVHDYDLFNHAHCLLRTRSRFDLINRYACLSMIDDRTIARSPASGTSGNRHDSIVPPDRSLGKRAFANTRSARYRSTRSGGRIAKCRFIPSLPSPPLPPPRESPFLSSTRELAHAKWKYASASVTNDADNNAYDILIRARTSTVIVNLRLSLSLSLCLCLCLVRSRRSIVKIPRMRAKARRKRRPSGRT